MGSYYHIPTFIINLKKRSERRRHILNEFNGRNEFDVQIINACEHKIGSIGLWNTIRHVIQDLVKEGDKIIILCEDDHQFTEHYSKEYLFRYITEARDNDADILLGGVSWFNSAVQISQNLFWIQKFSGLQFTIIFRKAFHLILEAQLFENDAADYKIASLTNSKFLIHPFVSIQKEFGYSDVTEKNNKQGHVDELFGKSSASIQNIRAASLFYKTYIEKIGTKDTNTGACHNITIPTYIINLPERTERREHTEKQFGGKNEFDITIVEAIRHKSGAYGLWLSIRKIIELAIDNNEDVIIICEDDHEFTEYYSKEYLLLNIIEAHAQGADILLGGMSYFSLAAPISKNRFWVNSFYGAQFVVLYRKFFKEIIDEPFDESVTADDLLSEMTSHKMALFPFISIQKEFGYSDVTERNNNEIGLVTKRFKNTADRLEIIRCIYNKYSSTLIEDDSKSTRPLDELIAKVNDTDFSIISKVHNYA